MILLFTVTSHWFVIPEDDPVPDHIFTFESIAVVKSVMNPHRLNGKQSALGI